MMDIVEKVRVFWVRARQARDELISIPARLKAVLIVLSAGRSHLDWRKSGEVRRTERYIKVQLRDEQEASHGRCLGVRLGGTNIVRRWVHDVIPRVDQSHWIGGELA